MKSGLWLRAQNSNLDRLVYEPPHGTRRDELAVTDNPSYIFYHPRLSFLLKLSPLLATRERNHISIYSFS